MRRLGWHLRWLAVGVLVPLSWPAFAAGIDCKRAKNPVEKAICASPRLSELDTRLSDTYAKAVAQDRNRRSALQRDEQNWLAERDDLAWRLLSDPGSASAAVTELRRLYRDRIAFLGSVEDPQSVPDSPFADKLLAAVRALAPGTTNVLQALQSHGVVALSQQRRFPSVAAVIAALPEPPAPSLRKALERYSGVSDFTVVYFPSASLGGVFNVEGTAECRYWVVFEKRGAHTVLDEKAPGQELDGCWNSVGRLALLDGQPVAINETDGIASQETDLQWRRFRNATWAAPVRVRIRFDRVLRLGFAGCAVSVDCASVRDQALRYAALYDRQPLPSTLLNPRVLKPAQRPRFLRMVAVAEGGDPARVPRAATAMSEQRFQSALAHLCVEARNACRPHEQTVVQELPFASDGIRYAAPRFGPYPPVGSFESSATYFPVHLNGRLALGRIGHGQIGWRQYDPWRVGMWRWDGKRLTSLAGIVVNRDNGRVLLAARMPPRSKSP